MWEYLWLGQQTYHEYRAIIRDTRIKYIIDNPYRLSNLQQPDRWFFPWPDYVLPIAIWSLFLAFLLFWIYKRINTSSVYGCASLGFGLLGTALLFGFQSAFPLPIYMFMFFVSITILVGCLSTFMTVLAVDKLPYFGCPEKYLLDDKKGFPRKYIPYVLGFFFIFVLWMLTFDASDFFRASLLHNEDNLNYCLGLMALFGGIFGNAALPYVTLKDRFQLDGQNVQIIEPLLKINGPAPRFEIIFSVILICVLYTVVSIIVNRGMSGADFIGILLIGGIGLTIVHAEVHRSDKVGVVTIKKERGLWN